ncbi:MAG: hypothetical protein C5B49_09835 [Bdellovibrio sp.]|nr:MAG: hypothetical protein C5B49_09835 [Bdellovibrio sp.]
MVDLVLIHRKSKQDFSQLQTPVWKTCLRQIAFLPPEYGVPTAETSAEMSAVTPEDQIFRDGAALRFLLEILCGLHSPIFGETEVFGQFKVFFDSLPESHVLKRTPGLAQMVFRVVKEVRSTYLRAAGTFSYGQMLRRKLKDQSRVQLWGYGQLGQEIGRWLKSKRVTILVRDPEKVKSLAGEFAVQRMPESVPTNPVGVHIIVAPLSDAQVAALAQNEATERIYDLRGESQLQHPKVNSLRSLMAEIEVLKLEQKKLLPACRQMIAGRVAEYLEAAFHRPHCWEDLCG